MTEINKFLLEDSNWQTAWSNLLYVNNFVRESYMGWTWSLAIEEQFYVIIPFAIAFVFPFFKNKAVPFISLALISIGLTYHYSVNIFDFQVPFNSVFGDDAWKDWFWEYYMLTQLRYGGLLAGVIGAYINVYHQEKLLLFFKKNNKTAVMLFIISLFVFFVISSISLGQWTQLILEWSNFSFIIDIS